MHGLRVVIQRTYAFDGAMTTIATSNVRPAVIASPPSMNRRRHARFSAWSLRRAELRATNEAFEVIDEGLERTRLNSADSDGLDR
jgi:hypothetical protein